ncbi:MAG: hypothetical protein K0R48_799, partial [Gammaproteobacteria bacterium]|nr:hypothetical protein [Gammaproteobacteria bacterium]
GLGGHIRLEQSLKDNLQLQAQTTLSQLFDNYAARLNWIWNSKQNRALSAGLNSSYTQDHTTERNFWVNGVNVSVIWDTPSVKKAAMPQNKVQNTEATESLSKWVQTPAVRLPDVLAISDERITQVGGITPFVSVTGFCPAASDVQYDSITRTYGASGGWYQSYPQNQVLQYDVISFNSANITAGPPGKAACLYGGYQGAVRVSLVLENNIYKNATGTGGNWIAGYSTLWPPALPPPVSYCQAIPNGCQFTTVAP